MAYLKSDKSTLEADRGEVLGNISHIIPGILYPAVKDEMLNGSVLTPSTIGPNSSTVSSSKYGTVQSDGKMYYYTDIQGSRPIKDPRIGAHFGSQRYEIRAQQLLEQETAYCMGHGGSSTFDNRVYSFDGREFFRGVGIWDDLVKDNKGGVCGMGDYGYLEITGFFNQANLLLYTYGYTRTMTISLDGENAYGGFNPNSSQDTPLRGRYVPSGHVINIPLTSADSNLAATPSLGIHTLKFFTNSGGAQYPTGVELIAHDITSTATRNQLQIPTQKVVSFGKTFTVSGTPHYNPFAENQAGTTVAIGNTTAHGNVATGWAGTGAGYFDDNLDTATSLGLSAWETGGNFYRPVNGGRIVKWVDSSGTIKTSVNMMPPDAHAIERTNTTLVTSSATGHAWTTSYQPQFGHIAVGSAIYSTDFSATTGWTPRASHATIASISGGQSGNCLEMTVVSSYPYATHTTTDFVEGNWYIIRVYAKTGSGNSKAFFGLEAPGHTYYKDIPLTSDWVEHQFVFQADHSNQGVILGAATAQSGSWSPNSGTVLFDTYSIQRIADPNTQSEVAKTFHWREFGNGAGNTGSNSTYPDASMLQQTNDDFGYVMDDGLTTLNAETWMAHVTGTHDGALLAGAQTACHLAFIGTGLSINFSTDSTALDSRWTVAQNLPYGTHVLKIKYNVGFSNVLTLDGVDIMTRGADTIVRIKNDITFHQPKMPPIPEDAVVIADYMLMADFVVKTGTADGGAGKISKGIRFLSCARDVFYDGAGLVLTGPSAGTVGFLGVYQYGNDTSTLVSKMPSFSTQATKWTYNPSERRQAFKVNGSTVSPTASAGGHGGYYHPAALTTLGHNTWSTEGVQIGSSPSGTTQTQGWEFANPIHTSSHYQTFETPNVHELVGGDRNIEQTNLVVTPDGKTWDEVVRNTSYLGPSTMLSYGELASNSTSTSIISEMTDIRGGQTSMSTRYECVQKGIAIGLDRWIILEEGEYVIDWYASVSGSTNYQGYLIVNSSSESIANSFYWDIFDNGISKSFRFPTLKLKRYDYLYMKRSAGTLVGDPSIGHRIVITKREKSTALTSAKSPFK